MMKHELYAINSMSVPVSPLDGVYIISTVPRRKPPPTQVAVGQITTVCVYVVHTQSTEKTIGHVITV